MFFINNTELVAEKSEYWNLRLDMWIDEFYLSLSWNRLEMTLNNQHTQKTGHSRRS